MDNIVSTTQVENLINQIIKTKVTEQLSTINVDKVVSERLQTVSSQIDSVVTQVVEANVRRHLSGIDAKSIVDEQIATSTSQIEALISQMAEDTVKIIIRKQLAVIDVKSLVNEQAALTVKSNLDNFKFPDGSIPVAALNFKDFKFSGTQVSGGIHESFGSTGIDDQATNCKLTIMDDFVVVENHLFAQAATVKGSLTIEGNLIVKGDINTDNKGFQKLADFAAEKATSNMLQEQIVDSIAIAAQKKIQAAGVDVDKITLNGKPIIEDGAIGKTVRKSSLQKVGVLDELQVKGEAYLSDTLYTTNKRTGINTLEPSASLAVWDEECELVVKKYEKNTGFIGSIRNQKVIIGSNNNVNIVLDTDGSTKISKLRIGNVSLNCFDEMPNWEGKIGDIVFNEEPKVNAPMGWICLGGARWACLPKITE
tara:strand:- start:7711 stop:8982 length:1272 start_codon:yes stop_codon:yes gene_type:complete